MSKVDKIYQEAVALPPDDLRRLIDMLSHVEAPGSPMTAEDSTDFRAKEMRWLSEHRGEFAGQWIVIEGDRLISSGVNAREVAEAARRAGISVPFMVHIETEDQLPFGGW
jgi:Family of unknown function (DUF5678)